MRTRSVWALLGLGLVGAVALYAWVAMSSAEALERRADSLASDSKYAEAIPLLEQALEKREAEDSGSIEVARLSSNLGVFYRRLGRLDDAEHAYKTALNIATQHGINDEATATCLHNLGELYEHEKRFDDAVVAIESARKIREKLLPNSTELAQTLSNLGIAYHRMGDMAHAEPFFDRAMALDAKALGPKDPRVAEDLANWAFLRLETGRYEDAEEMLHAALAIQEAALGADDPALRQTLTGLVAVYSATGRQTEAVALEERVRRLPSEPRPK